MSWATHYIEEARGSSRPEKPCLPEGNEEEVMPPIRTWSAWQARRLGAKTLEAAAALTGLSEKSLLAAWFWTAREMKMDLYEEILGAGLAVRYDDNGVVEFVFLDEEDKVYRVLTSCLDEGWKDKLVKALNGSK